MYLLKYPFEMIFECLLSSQHWFVYWSLYFKLTRYINNGCLEYFSEWKIDWLALSDLLEYNLWHNCYLTFTSYPGQPSTAILSLNLGFWVSLSTNIAKLFNWSAEFLASLDDQILSNIFSITEIDCNSSFILLFSVMETRICLFFVCLDRFAFKNTK